MCVWRLDGDRRTERGKDKIDGRGSHSAPLSRIPVGCVSGSAAAAAAVVVVVVVCVCVGGGGAAAAVTAHLPAHP